MRRRRHVRILALPLTVATLTGLAGCDTDDGRDMQEPDPYDVYALENTTPSTSSTTTTLPPSTTLAPPTTEPVAVTLDSVADSSAGTAAATTVEPAAASTTRPSTSAPGPTTSVTPTPTGATLPPDTFAESLGLANLASEGVEFTGPWTSGDEIDVEYTCNGDQAVPLLTWTAPPVGPVELAVVVVDETADDFAHWVVIGLPPEAGSVGGEEPLAVGSEAMNSFGNLEWGGPCPTDHNVHTYRFTLYALSQALELPPESLPGDLIQAIEALASGATSFTGTYQVA